MRAVRGVDALDDEAFVALFVHYGACLAQFPTVLPGRLNFLSFVSAMGDRLLEVVRTINAFELHHLSVVRVEDGIQSLVQVPAQRLWPRPPRTHRAGRSSRPDAGGGGSGMWPNRSGDPYRRPRKG